MRSMKEKNGEEKKTKRRNSIKFCRAFVDEKMNFVFISCECPKVNNGRKIKNRRESNAPILPIAFGAFYIVFVY